MLEIKRPVSVSLSPEQVAAIQETVSHYQAVPGGVLPALHAVQALCGNWLPLEALKLVAQGLDIPYPYLYGVMSFYTMFSPTPRGKFIIRMCESPPCHILGADDLVEVLKGELGIQHVGDTTSDGLFTLEHTACLGVCEVSPAMQINEVVFGRLTPERIKGIIADYRAGKVVDYRTLPRTTNPLSDYPASGDELVLLANVDQIDPLSLDAYLARGGYEGLKKALAMTQEEVVNTVKDSGLRGRGGAGFPTGLKWSFTRPLPAAPKYIVCNADEGEPGTIKDRYIMEGDPHKVLEGMAIAGYAVGASFGYIYVRGEYYLSMFRLNKAIADAEAKGYLGDNILGTGFSFRIQVQTGGGSYVCGEETALIESIEGKRGNPRVKPPFPGTVGVWDKPTIVNNVESLSSVPAIVVNGADWYKAKGTEDARGTKIFQVVGHVNRPGVVEANLGMTVRELIDHYGGGVRDGHHYKTCQTGGSSFGFFLEEHLDTPMEYKAMAAAQGALGSGTMLVMDDSTCVVDVVRSILYFFQHESCGFCLPCRRGTRVLYELISKVAAGQGSQADLDRMISLAQIMVDSSNCALGMSPLFFIKTTIERFKDEYQAHLDGKCPLGVCKAEEPSH
jgi:NADH:ubiquinone oxidoreductase subunit F (NADH-binding)/NADH:ubiquinone oxidoreductase subunit E